MPDMTDSVLKEIAKEFGAGIIGDGQDIIDHAPKVISVSPYLDIGLQGGIPKGGMSIFSGPDKVGKTTTVLSFAKKCQDDGMTVFWLDVEHRLSKKNVTGIQGLRFTKPHFHHIRSSRPDAEEGKAATILDAQKFLTIGEKLLRSVPNCLVVFDSFSMLADAKEMDGGIGTETRGGGAKLLAQFCRQMAPIMTVNQSIVVGVLQLMANTSGYGAAIVEKGGKAVQYQLNCKVKAKKDTPWVVGDKQIGQVVTWQITESALGPPGREVESYIRYGVGVDHLFEMLKLAEDIGLIKKPEKSSWYTLDFMPTQDKPKLQGGEKVYQFLSDKPEVAELLQAEVRKRLGVSV